MHKLTIISMLLFMQSCTDQGDPINFAIKNSSTYSTNVILYNRFDKKDTTTIENGQSIVLYKIRAPYDDGPFGGFDSLRVVFEDSKMLTYRPYKSKDECINSTKNPFCQNSSYLCSTIACTFDIDTVEYEKAK